jgi:hypothetical protein
MNRLGVEIDAVLPRNGRNEDLINLKPVIYYHNPSLGILM